MAKICLPLLGAMLLAAPGSMHAQASDSSIALSPRMMVAPPCRRDNSQLLDGPRPGFVSATPSRMVIPEFRGRIPWGVDIVIRARITELGAVDSVEIVGVTDSVYRQAVRDAAFKARYRPATQDGCLVSSWYEYRMNFPRDR